MADHGSFCSSATCRPSSRSRIDLTAGPACKSTCLRPEISPRKSVTKTSWWGIRLSPQRHPVRYEGQRRAEVVVDRLVDEEALAVAREVVAETGKAEERFGLR